MVRRLPSLNALRAFEAAARNGSLTLASVELNVAQAAISRHVRELESWLGAKLFHRTGRGVTLTDEGCAFAADLTGAFDRLAAAVDRFDHPGKSKQLVVSVDVAFAALWLVPRLKRFLGAHPDVELVIDPNTNLVDYSKGEADIGVRYGGGDWKGVAAELLFDARIGPVCSPRMWAGAAIVAPEGLTDAALIREDRHDYWFGWFAAAGVIVPAALGGTQVRGEMAIAAAESGSGIALADDVQAGDALMAGRLVRPFDIAITPAGYYLVHAKGARLSKPAQAFRSWLMDERRTFVDDFAVWQGRRQGVNRARRKRDNLSVKSRSKS